MNRITDGKFIETYVHCNRAKNTSIVIEFTTIEGGQRKLIKDGYLLHITENLNELLYLLGMHIKNKRALQSQSKS